MEAFNERGKQDYPAVSVVVPASRQELASRALESLSHQCYRGTIEIIVVGIVADELAKQWLIIPVNRGLIHDPGKARNLGAAHATGTVLLFLDDDCTVTEEWVDQNVQGLQEPKVGAVGARIRGRSSAFFAHCTDFTNFGYYQHGRVMDQPVAAASMGLLKTVFQAVGGFDETKHYGEEEDIDLCHRIQKLGYRTVYHPEIVVMHDHRRDTLGKLLRHNYRAGRNSGLTTKIEFRDLGLKNWLLSSVRYPPLFLLLLPLIALGATTQIVAANLREHREVLFHAPFILLAKLIFEFGVFRHLSASR